jgi:hypothetical protein
MKPRPIRTIRMFILALALLVAAGATTAQETRQRTTAGGIEIFYGFLPAEVADRHTAVHDAQPMHGGARRGDYHLMVALYDQAGQRITDAGVRATVGELGLAGTAKTLDRMVIGDTITFGHYFPMRNVGRYRVTLEIELPGAPRPIEARFDHSHR